MQDRCSRLRYEKSLARFRQAFLCPLHAPLGRWSCGETGDGKPGQTNIPWSNFPIKEKVPSDPEVSGLFVPVVQSHLVLHMILGEVGVMVSSRAVRTAAIRDAAIRRTFFCRGPSGTRNSIGESSNCLYGPRDRCDLVASFLFHRRSLS